MTSFAPSTFQVGAPSAAGSQQPQTDENFHSALSSSQQLPSLHLDYIHDISYDHYGRRLATCSGDRFIRVWDLNSQGEWTSHTEWQAHRGTVNRLSWAHPEYGQLLASCGSDQAVIIWEEREMAQQPQQQQEAPPTTATHWVLKAQLTDARKSVTCVQFAPRHLGLKIATGSADGFLRIYEAIDVMNLIHWPMNGSMDVLGDSTNDESAMDSLTGLLGVTALAWCQGRFEPPTLVVGTGRGDVSVVRFSDSSRAWQTLVKLPIHHRGVLDLAWAPNVGRSYHLIASAGKDRSLRVNRLNRHLSSKSSVANSLDLESSQVLGDGMTEVWRCAWNVTGTVLASSGDGGMVQLWKSNFRGEWKCVGEIMGDISAGGDGLNQNTDP